MSYFQTLDDSATQLWRDFRDDTTNQLTRNALVLHYDALAKRAGITQATSTHSLRSAVDADDLQQEMRIVLCELVEAFDPYRGVPFRMYAASRLFRRAFSAHRDLTGVKRSMEENQRRPAELDALPEFDRELPPAAHSIDAERELRHHVVARLKDEGMPRRQIALLLLRYWRGHTNASAAHLLNRSESWASTTSNRIYPSVVAIVRQLQEGRRAA